MTVDRYLRPSIFGLNPAVDSSVISDQEALRIAVGGNSGNLAFHYAIDKPLGGNVPIYPWHSEILPPDGVGILPCANQLGRHCNMTPMYDWFQTNDFPFVAIGLGAQSGIKVNGEYPLPTLQPGT